MHLLNTLIFHITSLKSIETKIELSNYTPKQFFTLLITGILIIYIITLKSISINSFTFLIY